MELRHLQHIVALSEEGSFTKAAQRVHIVQSGLSASIKELEQELSSRLVERTTRKVAFTETGRQFVDHARATLAALDAGIQAVRSQDGVIRGRLRVGILQSLGPYLDLPLLLKRFRTAYPEVEISARALNFNAIPALVRSGDIDLSFHPIVGRSDFPGLQVIPYAQDSLVAICSRTLALGTTKSVLLCTLAKEVFVDLTVERALRRLIDQAFAEHHLKRNTVFEVSDIPTALQFVEKGLGVAVVPSALARSLAISRELFALKIRTDSPKMSDWRVTILRRPRHKAIPGKNVVDLFLDALAGMTPVT